MMTDARDMIRPGDTIRPRDDEASSRRLRRRLAAVLLTVVTALPLPASAVDADGMLADPTLEARARAIGKELRCLVCPNQSIFDSNAGLARDLRLLVRERVAAGDGAAEVKAHVVARYGDYVLLKPPVKPLTYMLWLAPVLLVLAALGLGDRMLRRAAGTRAPLSAEERDAARRLLTGDDR